MVVISDITHAETYRDILKQFPPSMESTQATPAEDSTKVISTTANNFDPPDFAPTAESFCLKLTDKLTIWLRKRAD